jgi:hypothetical protein
MARADGGRMNKVVFRLSHPEARRRAAQHCMEAAEGLMVTFAEPSKSRGQEAKYHAMFGEIARQVPVRGVMLSEDDMKRALFSAFKIDTKDDPDLRDAWAEFGEARMGIGFRGEIVVFGDQTRRLPKRLASALIEWLYAFGAESGVEFMDEREAA